MASPFIENVIRENPSLSSAEIANKHNLNASYVRQVRRLLRLAEPVGRTKTQSDVLGSIEEAFEIDPKTVIAHCIIMGGIAAAETLLTALTRVTISRQAIQYHVNHIQGFPKSYQLQQGVIDAIKDSAKDCADIRNKIRRRFTEFANVR